VIGGLRTSMNGRYTAEVTSHEIFASGCSGGTTGSKETVKFAKADHFIGALQACTTDKKSSDDKLGNERAATRSNTPVRTRPRVARLRTASPFPMDA
jgi:hypothetical protein